MIFILAQFCGITAVVLTVIAVQFKTKESIVMCSIFANIVVAIQFFLLNAITGAGWTIYDIIVKVYVGVIQESSQLISAIIALIRDKKGVKNV